MFVFIKKATLRSLSAAVEGVEGQSDASLITEPPYHATKFTCLMSESIT